MNDVDTIFELALQTQDADVHAIIQDLMACVN